MAEDVKDVKDVDVPDINNITMDDLTGIINTAVKDATPDAIQELKDQIADVEKKAIFPDSAEGDELIQSRNDSVINTSVFSKNYNYGTGSAKSDGTVMGKQLITHGGAFLKLSPEMETFSKLCKLKFNRDAILNAGIDIKEYNSKIREDMKAAGMSEGTDADGGYLVPVEFYNVVIQFATQQSPILSQVWRLPMSGLTLKIPKLAQAAGSYFGGISLYWKSEAEEKPDTKAAFEQLEFTAHKLIGLIYLTDELIADSAINIINFITGLFTRAFQYEMERVIIRGNGTSQPLGIVSDPGINFVARQTANAIEFDDIVNMDTSLDENFRNLTWITRKTVIGAIRKLKDTNDQPIFHSDYHNTLMQGTNPPSLFGYPIMQTRNCPALYSTGDLILGDLSMYILAMRQELNIAQSTDVRFIYDETAYRFVARLDGKPAVSEAFSVLKSVAS